MKDSFNIVIIDDIMKPRDPLIMRFKKLFPTAKTILIDNVDEGISYIFEHIEQKNIVFFDCMFDFSPEGMRGLTEIREKTSLISVVMMSANRLEQMGEENLKSMINYDNISFITKGDHRSAESIIIETQRRWDTQLDCVLEQWVQRHSAEEREKPYMRTEEGLLSLNDIMTHIRKRTKIGLRLESNILNLAIDLLTKDNVKAGTI